MKYDKKTLIGAGVAVLLLVIAFAFTLRHKKAEAPLPVVEDFTVSVVIEQPKVRAPEKFEVDYTLGVTYTQAIVKYKDANLIQFTADCQARPRSLVVANGSTIMLDNRSASAELITIGGRTYSMDPYSFKIVTLTVEHLPAVYSIDCKTAQNVGTLTIE